MSSPPARSERQTMTPFLLKLFYRNGAFHSPSEFSPTAELPPHVQIYTWSSCTLRELSHLLTSALPSLLPDPAIGTRLSYRLLYPDTRNTGAAPGPPKYITKDLGSVIIGEGGPGFLPIEEETSIVRGGQMAGPLGGEPEKTLQDARFVIGDYVCCAIVPPMENGGVGPPPTGPSSRNDYGGGRAGMGPRESGNPGGYRGRGGPRVGGNFGQGFVPSGEWRRGEQVPEGPRGGRGGNFGGGFGGGRGGRY